MPGKLEGHQGGHRIADHSESRVHRFIENESIRKRLKARGFANRNRPGLFAVVMNVGVAVMAEMSKQGARRSLPIELAPLVRELFRVVGRNDLFAEGLPLFSTFGNMHSRQPAAVDLFLEELLGNRMSLGVVITGLHPRKNRVVAGKLPSHLVVDSARCSETRPALPHLPCKR